MNNTGSMFEQRRIIYIPKNEENTKVPIITILVMLEKGTIGEARTIRRATAIVNW